MAKKLWVGLDVGVETTSICVVDDLGMTLHETTCPTTVGNVHREIAFLKRRRFARVGLEAGVGISLARGLSALGYSVDIYEARALSNFLRIRRNKTDAGDASGIAQAGRLGATVSKVHMKSLECQSLASRLTIRRKLISTRMRLMNLFCGQMELFGGRIGSCSSPLQLRKRADRQIREVFGKAPSPLVSDLRDLACRCEDLMIRQQQIDRDLARLARENDVCARLMSIPGVGPICALTFYASVGEPRRFRKASDVGAYFGLTPKVHQSGLTYRMGRISKMGHTATRTLLVQASTCFLRWADAKDGLYAWAAEIEQRRGRKRARIALARKLATIMLAIWKSGNNYQPKFVEA